MARDPRKNSAFDSGMRGREKPKAAGASETGGVAAYEGKSAAHASGMRGNEKSPTQQSPGGKVGNPDGEDTAAKTSSAGVSDGQIQAGASKIQAPGGPGENLEDAAVGNEPQGPEGILGEEDDTHIHLKVPKSSLKRRGPANG